MQREGIASRINAFLIHLAISMLIISLALMLVLVCGYPASFFDYQGVWQSLQILISVALIIGPLLAMLAFKAGKRSLWLDMAFIIALQFAAFGYHLSVIFDGVPDIHMLPRQSRRLDSMAARMARHRYDLQALALRHGGRRCNCRN